ncbi:MAG: YveK family protein [Clostridia bacterium]
METIDISVVMKIMRKRLWLIVTVVLLCVAASGAISFYVLQPVYEASSTIVVQGKSSSADSLYNDLRANQELVKTYSSIIKSRKVAEDVIAQLKLPVTPVQLLQQVRVLTDESLVTTISVVHTDPVQAVSIANAFAQSFRKNLPSIMEVDNVSILDEAKLEGNPSPIRPRPYVNMGIALVVSLMASVGLAFLLAVLDKTIQSEEHVEKYLELPVLGIIPRISHQKLGKRKKERMIELEGQETG